MAYDAGKNYNYQISAANFAKYVGKNKVRVGLSIGKQWAATGSFVESLTELQKRANWIGTNGYGGAMVWAIGAQGGSPIDTQITEIKKILR